MSDKGIAIPTQIIHGRARLSEKAEQLSKIILLSLADGDSMNPFATDYGMPIPVFNLADQTTRSLIKRAIEKHFERFEAQGRARLEKVIFRGATDPVTGGFSSLTSDAGNFEIHVHYTNLESGTDQTIVKNYRLSGG